MSVLSSLKDASDNAVDAGENYIKSTKEYYKLKLFDSITDTVSTICKIFFLGAFSFSALILMVVAGIMALGHYLNSMIFSCLIFSLIFIVMALVIYGFRTHINNLVIRKISDKFFDE